jgi:exoribonuclease II
MDQQIDHMLASRPRRRQNRNVTDKERAEWTEQHQVWQREREAQAATSRQALAVALENRKRAERAVEDALLAALELNTAEPVRKLMGMSPATFWRRVAAARDAQEAAA